MPQASLPHDGHWARIPGAAICIQNASCRLRPSALIAVLLSVVAVALLSLESVGVKVIGEVESGMVSLTVPEVSPGQGGGAHPRRIRDRATRLFGLAQCGHGGGGGDRREDQSKPGTGGGSAWRILGRP